MYLLKLALRPIRYAPISQLLSSMVVGLLLLLSGFLFWMHQSLKPLLARLQGEQVVSAYLDSSVEKKDETRILDAVRSAVEGSTGPLDIKLVTSSQFVELIRNHYPDLGKELEGLGADSTQIIPRYVSVTGVLPSSAVAKIRSIPGIEQAETSKDRYHFVIGAFSTLRWVVSLLIVGLGLALMTGLVNLSRLNSYLHRDALHLLRQWGASRKLIMVPGILSGFFVGTAGGVLAVAGWVTLAGWLAHHIRSLSTLLKWMPLPQTHVALLLLCLGGGLGMIAGLLGSLGVGDQRSDGGVAL